jgi:polyhydroxyalkanoate synthesis regulator protein
LQDLPRAEQSLYNGFTYSTHIYTDDPDLCAIVVDGQRLQVGDAFKGLKVTAITEQGVIFEENRRGVVREVEVNLLAQWEG